MSSGLKLRRSPRHFLQGPGVAIGVAEGSVLDALVMFLDLAHENTPANERFACLVYISHHQMQPLDRSRLHFHVGQASPKPDGACCHFIISSAVICTTARRGKPWRVSLSSCPCLFSLLQKAATSQHSPPQTLSGA